MAGRAGVPPEEYASSCRARTSSARGGADALRQEGQVSTRSRQRQGRRRLQRRQQGLQEVRSPSPSTSTARCRRTRSPSSDHARGSNACAPTWSPGFGHSQRCRRAGAPTAGSLSFILPLASRGASSATCRSSGTRWCKVDRPGRSSTGSRSGELAPRADRRPTTTRARRAAAARPARGRPRQPGLSAGAARGRARARDRLHDAAASVADEPWLHESLWHSIKVIFWGFLISSIVGVPARDPVRRAAVRSRGSPSRSSSSSATCRRRRSARWPSPCSASTTRRRSPSSSSAPSSSRSWSSRTRRGGSIRRCSRRRRRWGPRRGSCSCAWSCRASSPSSTPTCASCSAGPGRTSSSPSSSASSSGHHLLHQPAGEVPQLRVASSRRSSSIGLIGLFTDLVLASLGRAALPLAAHRAARLALGRRSSLDAAQCRAAPRDGGRREATAGARVESTMSADAETSTRAAELPRPGAARSPSASRSCEQRPGDPGRAATSASTSRPTDGDDVVALDRVCFRPTGASSSASSARRAAASRRWRASSPASSRCTVGRGPARRQAGRTARAAIAAWSSRATRSSPGSPSRKNVMFGLEVSQGMSHLAAPSRRRASGSSSSGSHKFAASLPAPALGRHEAAGGHRARAGEPAAHPAHGRAVRRARRADARADAVVPAADLEAGRHHDRLHHPRSRRGHLPRRSHPRPRRAPGRVRELMEVPVPRPRDPTQFLSPTFVAAQAPPRRAHPPARSTSPTRRCRIVRMTVVGDDVE